MKGFVKFYLVILNTFLFYSFIQAQSLTPQVISGISANLSAGNYSIRFTAGGLTSAQQNDIQGNSLSSGFINSSTLSTSVLSVIEPEDAFLKCKVYPNPVSNFIQVSINSIHSEAFSIRLSDMQGRCLQESFYNGNTKELQIPFKNLAPGIYILLFRDKKNQIKSIHHVIRQ